MKHLLANHPQCHSMRLQLKRHALLSGLADDALMALSEMVVVHDAQRGECLLEQGSRELRQFFVLDGLLKRIVTSPLGREMTLRFAAEGDFETLYDAWRRNDAAPYSVVCAARSCIASLTMNDWCSFLARHPAAQQVFRDRVVALSETLVDHAVRLLLLDASARVDAFSRLHPQLMGRLVQKDLASHLNLSAETLCRLSRSAAWRVAKGVVQGPLAAAVSPA
jgi:CRP-like cAMP-binding protein